MPPDFVAGLDANALRGARLGVLRGRFAGYSPQSDRVLDAAIAKLKALGAELLDPVALPNAGKYDESELEVLKFEFKANLNTYLAGRPGLPVKTLADVIAFNEKNRDKEMPHFGQELFLDSEKKGPLTDPKYLEALQKDRTLSREGHRHRADVVAARRAGGARRAALPGATDLVNGDHYLGSSTTPAAVAGYPSITVPAGEVAGLPIGVSFFGTAWSEAKLIKLAYAFEQAMKARKPPGLK